MTAFDHSLSSSLSSHSECSSRDFLLAVINRNDQSLTLLMRSIAILILICLNIFDDNRWEFLLNVSEKFLRDIKLYVKILKTVTVWIQIYTYRSANWSMILQSSLLFFYITSISWRFESHQVILWSHFFYHRDHIVWLISLSSIDLSSSIDSVNFREDHVIFVIFELSYFRIVNDSLNLIRRTR